MITGMHAIVFSRHAEALRAFFADVLGMPSADAGDGWPIFAAPPAEIAVHPTDDAAAHELFLMCDDVHAMVAKLAEKGVTTQAIEDRGWGLLTAIDLPGGERLGLYQPRHPSPLQAK